MMTIRKSSLSVVALFMVSATAFLGPEPLMGQEYLEDFMFHPPKVTLNLNFGYGVPSAGSEIFTDVINEFTLAKNDFNAPVVGAGLSLFLNDRMDLAFELSYSKSSTWSEYTDYVGFDDLPIEQETQFTRVPVTASFRYFLMDRGRAIGSLSWIPTAWAPYIGVGGGRMFYEFQQAGEFIKFSEEDWPIVQDQILSEGWAWVGHVFGGVQWAFATHMIVTAEGRYSLSDADLDRPSYVGLDPIDLSGFQGTLGFGVRF